MLTVINDAQAAALSLSDIVNKVRGVKDTLSKVWDTIKTAGAGAIIGAVVLGGACTIVSGGLLAPACAAGGAEVGAAIGALIGGGIGIVKNFVLDNEEATTSPEDGRTPTYLELITDLDLKEKFGEFYEDAQAAALADIQALKANLLGSLVPYSISIKGGELGSFKASLEGPSVLYGYSAFPVVLKLDYAQNPDIPDPIHITKVTMYVVEDATGYTYYTWTWVGDYVMENSTVTGTWATILKAPDQLVNDVDKLLSGQFDAATIDKLFNTPVPKFEVYVKVEGYKELYKYENGKWVKYDTEPFSFTISSLDAYERISNYEPSYELSGAVGTLPSKFKLFRSFTPYTTQVAGSINNIIIRAWSTPVHYVGSSADYAFYFIALPEYFSPLRPTITDDYRLVVVKDLGGTWALADSVVGNLGDMSTLSAWAGSIVYTKDDQATGYNVFMVVKAYLDRGDTKIPLWLIAKPKVAVLPDEETITVDANLGEIEPLLNKTGTYSAEDLGQLKAWADATIQGINQKISEAEAWKAKTDNEKAKALFDEAISHYKTAISYLNRLKSVTGPDTAKKYIKIAKNEEIIGDYYKEAAIKAHYGDEDQVDALIQNAKQVEEATNEYVGSSSFLGGAGDAVTGFVEDLADKLGVPTWVIFIGIILLALALLKYLLDGR